MMDDRAFSTPFVHSRFGRASDNPLKAFHLGRFPTILDESSPSSAPGFHQIELVGDLAGILNLAEADMTYAPSVPH